MSDFLSNWPKSTKIVDGKMRVSAMPYLYDIAELNVANHTPFSKLGYNGDVGATEEDIWSNGSEYVFPSAAMPMEVVSTSVEDDPDKGGSVAGTGVHTLRISYLDNTYASKVETINLNGQTAVPTVAQNILRVNAIRATVTGTAKKAIGTITVRHIDDTPIYRVIDIGYTRGRGAIYTVPLGKTLYLTSIVVSSGHTTSGKIVRWIGRATVDDYDNSLTTSRQFMAFFEVMTQDNSFYREFEMPILFPATADIKISAVSNPAVTFCSCALRGWLE